MNPICLHDIIPPADKTSSHVSHPHRIRMASSPSGSLLLFFSASFAFFFFLKPIFSFSRLDLTLCSWWAACCAKALDLGSLSVTVNRCLTLPPPSLSARCCLTLLTTKNTARASTRPIAMAITAHSHAGVDSFGGRKNRKWILLIRATTSFVRSRQHLKYQYGALFNEAFNFIQLQSFSSHWVRCCCFFSKHKTKHKR